ncbi:MAG: hypothetical protein AB1546_09645 [bacterium]
MKKFIIAGVITGVFLLMCGSAFSVGTADNWSVTLQFSTENTADLLPMQIGESTAATEMLKPPPLPGMADTGIADDALVNAYIRSASRQTATSILTADTTAPAKLWEIQVDVEEGSAQVSVTPTLTDFYDAYNLALIDADTGDVIDLKGKGGQKVAVFTSGASGSNDKTLYVLAGTSQTFAIAKSDGTVLGAAAVGGCSLPDEEDNAKCQFRADVKVYLDGSNTPTGTTGSDGTFDLSGISAGDHAIRIDADNMLASAGTLTVPTSGTAAIAVSDLRGGDANNDGTIGFEDLKCLKKLYKQDSGGICDLGDGKTGNADFDLNGAVEFYDLKILKKYYKQTE